MKTLLAASAALVFTVCTSNAGILANLPGKWVGDLKSIGKNGKTSTDHTTFVYKAFEKGGLLEIQTLTIDGDDYTGTTRYHKSGKVDGTLEVRGLIVATASGTWEISGDAMLAKIKTTSPFVKSYTTSQKTTLEKKKNRLYLTGRGGGSTTSGYLYRK